jgi:hypothetical protein
VPVLAATGSVKGCPTVCIEGPGDQKIAVL